ncbi:hypothetical protein BASA60_009774 [Batrachochytrium salamandrivorans]|nr:hypothetical protein BASA60_009774 [Batrachochytrium salamandrivorans]
MSSHYNPGSLSLSGVGSVEGDHTLVPPTHNPQAKHGLQGGVSELWSATSSSIANRPEGSEPMKMDSTCCGSLNSSSTSAVPGLLCTLPGHDGDNGLASGYIDSTTPSQSIKDLTAHLILQTSAPLKSDTGSPVVANHSYSNHAADWTAAHDSSNGCGSINPHSDSDKLSDQAIQTLESKTCSSRPAVLPIKKRKLKIPHDLPIKRNKVDYGARLAISDIIDPTVLADSISSQYETDARIPSPGCDTMPLSLTQGLRRYNSDPPKNTRCRKSTARTSFQSKHLSLSYTRRSMRVNTVRSIGKADQVNDPPRRTYAIPEIPPWEERKISSSSQHGIYTITTPITSATNSFNQSTSTDSIPDPIIMSDSSDGNESDSDESEAPENKTSKSIRTAMKMVKWAMTHNVWLSTTFEVECILGWGGCGVVLGATRRSNNEEVAIKIIYRQLSIACTPDGLPKEISLHQFLEHPNIVESIEHSSDDRAYYLVMERFGVRWNNHTGGASITITAIDATSQDVSNDLASVHETVVHHPHRPTHERRRYLRRADQISTQRPSMLGAFRKQQAHVSKKVIPESSKKLYFTKNSGTTLADYCDRTPKIPEPLAKTFFLDIAGAVNYIHSQGVVHGDIKEENILVGVEAETLKRVLKLCDFGYSRKGIPGSAPMKIYGTREFCPPELVDNMSKYMQRKKTKHGVVGYAQDVWALGLLLYSMIHGILPMETDSLLDKSLDITGCTYYPTQYDQSVSPTMPRCFAKDADDRP